MYLVCANFQMVKEMSPLFVSFNILPKKGRNIEENLLIEQTCHWGSILYVSPCNLRIYAIQIVSPDGDKVMTRTAEQARG